MLIRLFILALLAAGLIAGGWRLVDKLYVGPQKRLVEDEKLPPPTPPLDPSLGEFARCEELRKTEGASAARLAFEQFLKEFPGSPKRDDAWQAIGEINAAEFFAGKQGDSNVYVVKSGDSIGRISARSKIPVETVIFLNRMQRDVIHPGDRLLAPACDFRAVLQQKTRRVILYNGGKFFRHYPASVWPGMNRSPAVILPRQEGRVAEKSAINVKGLPIKPTEIAYYGANHIIGVTLPGHSLYTQPEDADAPVSKPAGGGIGLAPAHMSEIAILLPRGAPVTLE